MAFADEGHGLIGDGKIANNRLFLYFFGDEAEKICEILSFGRCYFFGIEFPIEEMEGCLQDDYLWVKHMKKYCHNLIYSDGGKLVACI